MYRRIIYRKIVFVYKDINIAKNTQKAEQSIEYFIKASAFRMNFTVVKGFRLSEISQWSKKYLFSGSIVVSDGLACFKSLKNAACQHFSIVTGGGSESVKKAQFIWVNAMIGNVKNSIVGTYHAIKHKHLPRYLAEFSDRFNRRFALENMLPRFAFIALRTPPTPNKPEDG